MPDEGGGVDISTHGSLAYAKPNFVEHLRFGGRQRSGGRLRTVGVYERYVKRSFDLVGGLVCFVLFMPFMALVAGAIVFSDGLPVLYTQERVGRDLRSFKMLKFRTMRRNADTQLQTWKDSNHPLWQEYVSKNFKLTRDPRMMRIGELLRRFSLDEVPQLWNVLCGDMSLVGPRPLPRYQLEDMLDIEGYDSRMRHSVRPGLTGLWQISGRSATTFAALMVHDLSYVENVCALRDISILARTPRRVLSGKGAY